MELQEAKYIKNLKGWFGRNWEFAGILLLFSLYMFLANFFMWGQSFLDGVANFSGGSDPYFNYIIIQYTITHHVSLLGTTGLNYPIGSGNPRPLFFHWMIVFVATITGPLLGGSLHAAYYAFMEFDAVFGALLIIPVYLLGKSILGKKAGMIGAVLYALMPSNLTSGILSDGRMHTPELFFAFFAIYFFERAVKFANKDRVIQGSLFNTKKYFSNVIDYIESNKKTTFYALFAGASFGALSLSWQGYAYILAVIAIYVVAQLIINLFLSRNTGYMLYITIIFVALSFSMAGYYYYAAHNAPAIWYTPPLLIGVAIIFLGTLISIGGRKPWIISIPILLLFGGLFLAAVAYGAPHIFHEIISGDGYFIKTRVYSTIAEAQAPALGQYISGFGVAQFILGIGGLIFIIYRFIREKTDSLFYLLVFSGVSIYMSFAAARFNVTATPAYAILGAALIYFFADTLKISKVKDDTRTKRAFRKRTGIKGDINWLQGVFVFIIVFAILIPSGLGMVSAAVPVNSAPNVNHQVYNALPTFAKPSSYLTNQSAYFGTTGSDIVNSSSPFSMSMSWLAEQQANLSCANKPAYVDWWDYGFQELYQGAHPTVADDFQQAYQIAGQILLSTNESQIISLFSARLLNAEEHNNSGKFTTGVKNVLSQYLTNNDISLLKAIYDNPHQYVPWILDNSSIYGKFIPTISNVNAYYALIKGQLASKVPLSNLINLYQGLQESTGWSIQYIQADHTLFPLSGTDTGTFYAPAYLTDTPSYTTSSGAVVPYEYYQIFAVTTNGTFPLNQTPIDASVTSYELGYTPAFYNTTIYKALIGLPPTAVGQTQGIPGLNYGSTRYTMEPAFNMSNFELCYEGVPYNPYTNYSAHPNAFKILPLQEAYTLQKHGKGVAFIFPQLSSIVTSSDPILRYFPGAIVQGQITTKSGLPITGIRATIYDQYGIPHETVLTNKNGYYNITALPGNDTVIFSYGALNKEFLEGAHQLSTKSIFISRKAAERETVGINMTTGLSSSKIIMNYQLQKIGLKGNVAINQLDSNNSSITSLKTVNSGTVTIRNVNSSAVYNTSINQGNYNFLNIPIGTYNISVVTNGHLYKNIKSVSVANASRLTKNLEIHPNIIDVTVKSYNKDVNKATVYINSKKYITNETGSVQVYVNTGTYSIYSAMGNLRSTSQNVNFTGLNVSRAVSLTLFSGDKLNLKLNSPYLVNNVTVFQNGQLSNSYNLTNMGNNNFNTFLPSGYYTIYSHTGDMGILKSFTINQTLNLSLKLLKVDKVNVIFNSINSTKFGGSVGVINGTNVIQMRYSSLKNTTFFLPTSQNYEFYAMLTKAGTDYYSTSQQYVTQLQNIYLNPEIAVAHTVEVYNPLVSNNFNSLSAASSGIGIFYLSGSPFEASPISNGYATLYSVSTLSSVSFIAFSEGFETTLSSVGQKTAFALNVPTKSVSLEFVSSGKASKLNGNIDIHGLFSTTAKVISGQANLTLPTGYYVFSLNGGNMFATNYSNIIQISKNNQTIQIYFKPLISLSITGVSYAQLYNMNGTVMSNPSKLKPGDYVVYSTSFYGKASIQEVKISENFTFIPTMQTAYYLNITNRMYGGSKVLNLMYEGKIIRLNTLQNLLPSGMYAVNLTDKLATSKGENILFGTKTVSLVTNTYTQLILKNETFYTAVNGKLGGAFSLSGYLINIYHNGILINQTTSSKNGSFKIGLQNGSYTYYAFSTEYSTASTGTFTLGYFQNTADISPILSVAHLVYVSTSISNKIVNLPVNVTLGNQKIIVMSSDLPVLLPSNNYTFTSYTSSSVTVNNYKTSNIFSASKTVYTNKPTDIQLMLSKIITGNISITQNDTSTVSEFSTVSYNLTITNRLNSIENLTLSSGSGAWKMKFNRTLLKNVPVNGTVFVRVTLNNTDMVQSGVNHVPINIDYSNSSLQDNIKVNITPFESYKVKVVDVNGAYNKGDVSYKLKFKNTGNTKEHIFISMSNLTNLSNLYNWNFTLLYNGHVISNLTLNYSQSKVITVNMVPINNKAPASNFKFSVRSGLTAKNENNYTNIYVYSPSAPSITSYPSGPGIIPNYTGDAFQTIEYGLIIIAIAVIGGIAGIAIRGRKRK
jgi:dolichyl-diphosphooligosaccharide--protein glycosyltransferase